MHADDADPDALCESFRELVGLDGSSEHVSLEVLLREVGADLAVGHRPGCVASLDLSAIKIHHNPVGPRVTIVRSLGHETGHLIHTAVGPRESFHETAYTHLGLSLALPRGLVRRVARSVGWDAHVVMRALPDYPPATIYRRMVETCGGAAIVRSKRQRVVYGPEYLCEDHVRLWEKRYLRRAKAGGFRDLWGVGAWRFEQPRPWSVILVPPSALDLMG